MQKTIQVLLDMRSSKKKKKNLLYHTPNHLSIVNHYVKGAYEKIVSPWAHAKRKNF